MTTKKRFRNKYALQVRERDYNPPHVHLFGGGVDIVIEIETLNITGSFPSIAVQTEVLTWIKNNHNELLKEWHKWHSQ